jgi:hypothetical protein
MTRHSQSFLLAAAFVGALFSVSAQAAKSDLTTCEAFLKRACSSSEKAGFERGLKPVHSKQVLTVSGCDSFLGRTCSATEQRYYERGLKTQVVKEQLACNCDGFLGRACSSNESLAYSRGLGHRTELASNCKYSGSTLALND